jgi:transcriptional regulator with XRE-family HTH domain
MMTGKQYFSALGKRCAEFCISHADLARESKINETQLSRWFSGRVENPRIDSLAKLDAAFERLIKKGAGCS